MFSCTLVLAASRAMAVVPCFAMAMWREGVRATMGVHAMRGERVRAAMGVPMARREFASFRGIRVWRIARAAVRMHMGVHVFVVCAAHKGPYTLHLH